MRGSMKTMTSNTVSIRKPGAAASWPLAWLVICINILLLAGPGTANADDWLYTVRPGDNLSTISSKYLTKKKQAADLRKLNRITNPSELQPGSKIRIPITWLKQQPSSSHLVQVQGEVIIIRAAGEQPESVNDEIRLYVGDTITTGANGTATLEFADKSRLLIQPDSELVMDTLSTFGDSGMVDTRLRLPAGRVETQVTPKKGPASRFEITTPAAVAAVRGTDFRVGADHDQAISRSEVLEGKVKIKGAQGDRDIPAGFGTVTKAGAPPIAPKKLLAAPLTTNTRNHFNAIPISFEWQALKLATAYRVQIYAADNADKLLMDKQIKLNRFELADLQDNDYILRVRAIDDLGLEGLNQDHSFKVDARPFPPVLNSPEDNSLLRQQRPVFKWSGQQNVGAYFLQIATDRDFKTIILQSDKINGLEYSPATALPDQPLYWRVAAVDHSTQHGPFSDTKQFSIRVLPDTPSIKALTYDSQNMNVSWTESRQDQRYHFQMATDENFENIVINKKIKATDSLALKRPQSNIYYYRTRAINSHGEASPFSQLKILHVKPLNYNNPKLR